KECFSGPIKVPEINFEADLHFHGIFTSHTNECHCSVFKELLLFRLFLAATFLFYNIKKFFTRTFFKNLFLSSSSHFCDDKI
ncbi:hypothetical protein P4S93_14755, partial [Aneurinibacillus thermoaerophilus]|uniref:hypothetical protein n=1 Tax=Aneurinibacillus thermoaerophilus TaxID=143495 RepID=UPI002E1C7EA6|nr:hypothetical protein [Aneurinibacillus thermoaerophilus]